MVCYEKWGEYHGKDILLYTLENSKGMKIGLTNFGCAVTLVRYKGIDVALGFDNPEAYINQTSYMGVAVGRYANRIRGGRFELDGKEYKVGNNLGNNHLHGGFTGFDKVIWDVDVDCCTENSVGFSYFSKDGEEGYPGNLTVKVSYSLDEDCGLSISYEAVTDQTTLVNLTNHSYFNLSGHDAGSIENQWVRIDSDYFLESDDECIPTGKMIPVSGTPFDFKDFHRIGERIGLNDIQLKYGGGYDHNWTLEQMETNGPKLVAEAYDDKTEIQMQVYTTMPGIQFYSGNSLNEKNKGKDGAVYGWRCGFCLETQYYPDSIHHPDFPQAVLKPGQVYRHTTVYKFMDRTL